ncbi:hypothetical protein U1708_08130 [Sphingomonas sp. ZB1N12]
MKLGIGDGSYNDAYHGRVLAGAGINGRTACRAEDYLERIPVIGRALVATSVTHEGQSIGVVVGHQPEG